MHLPYVGSLYLAGVRSCYLVTARLPASCSLLHPTLAAKCIVTPTVLRMAPRDTPT